MKTLSQALADLMNGQGNGGAKLRSAAITDALDNGLVYVQGSAGGSVEVAMATDQPQRAGGRLWVIEAPDGTVVGLGENVGGGGTTVKTITPTTQP